MKCNDVSHVLFMPDHVVGGGRYCTGKVTISFATVNFVYVDRYNYDIFLLSSLSRPGFSYDLR